MRWTILLVASLVAYGCRKTPPASAPEAGEEAGEAGEEGGGEVEGTPTSVEGDVTGVLSDRVLMVQAVPEPVAVVLEDTGALGTVKVGDRVRVSGLLAESGQLDRLEPPLDGGTRAVIFARGRFLYAEGDAITVIAGGAPTGTAALERPQPLPELATAGDPDANRDGMLERDEVRSLISATPRVGWDVDGDGNLTQEEALGLLFGHLDADGDGRASIVATQTLAERFYPGANADPAPNWDADADGWVSRPEFATSLRMLDDTAWDRDEDGRVDDKELADGLFEAWDLDHSGYLEAEEARMFTGLTLEAEGT